MKTWMVLVLIVISGIAFTNFLKEPEPTPIPPSLQRTGGIAAKGYTYLTTGDYVKGGIPYNVFVMGMGKNKINHLERAGKNANISHEYTAITATNGEILVAPNCMQCHAQVFDGELVMGLGNTSIDFSHNEKLNVKRLQTVENMLKLTAPNKYRAAKPFLEVTKTIGPQLTTAVRGVNAADRLAAVLVAHRDPITFQWNAEPQMDIPETVIPSDVPPWWLLKKKNAMFYNGFGRGDFGRFLMASNLLTVNDTAESREVDSHMPDLLAYIYSLEPPKYPKTIDAIVAAKGETIFVNNCSKCHGTKDSYPNLLIPQAIIQTDSLLYKANYSSPQFVNWFNRSWFTTGDHPARLEPFQGYIAPPLDGIWITAPYLHNGSVPTLEALLNSDLRPKYWSRDFDRQAYDYDKLGWVFTKETEVKNKNTYNTELPGYGNFGHTFGDRLNEDERKAVIEYLKTL